MKDKRKCWKNPSHPNSALCTKNHDFPHNHPSKNVSTNQKKEALYLIKTQLRLTNVFNYHLSVVTKFGNNTTKHIVAKLKTTTNEVKAFYSTNFETKTIFSIDSKIQYFLLRLSLFLNLHSCNIPRNTFCEHLSYVLKPTNIYTVWKTKVFKKSSPFIRKHLLLKYVSFNDHFFN